MNRGLSLLAALAVICFRLPSAVAEPPVPNSDEFFEKEVRPILVQRCLECHGEEKPKAGLRLTSRANVLKGTDNGPAAVAGKPDDSAMIQAVRHKDVLKMPKDGKLPDREIAVLTRWVELGLPWPKTSEKIVAGSKFQITDEQRKFWCFQPVTVVPPPALKNKEWARSDPDRYVLAGLEAKGLKPAKPADKRALLRRATFDLTGLPPTPQEIDAFLKDDSPDAFARVVDRLLASKAYGERWGRHWLDLVRYTDSFDSRGVGSEGDVADAWRYRDWVVDAFNRDLPYDKFLTDQIAGDLVPGKDGFNKDGIIATGFLAIGNWGGGDADKEKLLTDIADDQVDVVSRTFMGLTIACARCHDHKFDPISTADYYALGGIFFSTHILPDVGPKTNGPPMLRIPLATPAELEQRKQYAARLAEAEKQLKQQTDKVYRDFAQAQLKETAKYLVAAWEYQNPPAGQTPGTVAEFARRKELHEFALRQWLDYLGAGDYVLMPKPISNAGGMAGVFGWRGEPDCPNMLVNTTDKEVTITTLKLPPKSVAVHPGPQNGVAVAWRSPFTGTVKIAGGVTDADPNCGDGIAWIIDHRKTGSRAELASGDFPNGGAQRFDQGKNADRLKSIDVRAGDRIELLVLPKENYACDTTVVDLVITSADGSKVWDVTRDVVEDPLQNGKGNPHADRQGNEAVWHFLDMARSRRVVPRANANPALAAWERAVAEVAGGKRDRKAIEEAAREFQRTFTPADASSPFWITRREDETVLPAEGRADLAKRAAEVEQLKKNTPPLAYANGAQEGGVPGSPHAGVHDVRIHHRGRYDRLGDLVPRRFPEILAGKDQKPITSGSGRLQLAEWLTRPEHPLTARVMVNRIWQYHFGEGIVRTPSNFGKLGERPTHPELLDYLAHEFVLSGWSVKHMHRLIMLSATYQQGSEAEPETLKADPDNRLFGRVQRRRLEAEAVRDNLLAVSGKLDAKMGGPALRDFNAPRRTLYLMTIRSDRSGFGPLFDSADPTAPVDRRTITTVAPQALFLMNNPFVLEQTHALAKRITSAGEDEKVRVRFAYQVLYGRDPLAQEERIGLEFLKRGHSSDKAWDEYCQVLLCANEFLYVD
jgi:Protein of unknown function (DUF1553)/Protein of unknown function (DUF1549)/Planctomycete cytochrome C